jgi:hypothetical protein
MCEYTFYWSFYHYECEKVQFNSKNGLDTNNNAF